LSSSAAKIFSSKIAKRARLELEARTGKEVVTGENHLPPASAKKYWVERLWTLIGPFENLSPLPFSPNVQHNNGDSEAIMRQDLSHA
jgi:hypothetical protein